ncbi:MAG: hypothetical protein Q7S01_02060 [bacterium]|nr:hypothetical protein [bacterium]
MKKVTLTLVFLVVLTPSYVFAVCEPNGTTVVYVNGIWTNKEDADKDTYALTKQFEKKGKETDVQFINGYNPPHIGGFGDTLQSIAQAFGNSISDFDRDTILMQIHPQVSTRKILLLGHSQGTFYTNALYQYFLNNGVPVESLAVYNLATPADRVEGGGAYLTSTNDRVINGIRPWMAKAGAPAPLPANITIPLPPNEISEKAGGHHFSSSYLAGEPDRIVADISRALGNLKTSASTVSEGCFNPPPKTIAHKTKAVVFAIADPVAQAIKTADVAVVNAIDGAASATGRALGTGIIITGKAIVYTANVVTNAVVVAAQKAAAAAAYAAAQIRKVFATATSAAGKAGAASQVAAISPALLKMSSPPPAPAPAKPAPTVAPAPPTPKTVAVVAPITPKAPASPPPPPPPPPVSPPPAPSPSQPKMIVPLGSGLPLIGVSPGFGGGGGGAAPSPVAAPVSVSVPLAVQAPLEGAFFATSPVTFSGTTNSGYSVVASYAGGTVATVADSGGDWSIALSLPEGTISIGVVAADGAGNTSDAITRTVIVGTAPSAFVSECSASLSTLFCLIPTTSATLAWSPVAGTEYYAYAVNGATVATTSGTNVALSLAANASTTLSVGAYNAAGNAATSTPVDVYVATQPLIINEIAWAGTQAEASDEWIELKNNSLYALALSRFALVSADGSPSYIQLSGAITQGGYYLIERREEATSVAGNIILAFDELSNDGEELRLEWGSGSATTTVDGTPAVSLCGGWCSGVSGAIFAPDLINPMTMERDSNPGDATADNWHRGISTAASAETDASGNTISGTPRAENSMGGDMPTPPAPIGVM